MIITLSVLFFIISIEVLLIGFVFSKVAFKIEKLNLNSMNRKITDIYIEKMNIKLQIYIFKYIKIISIKLCKNYFEIFRIKIKYETFFKTYNITNKLEFYRKLYQIYRTIKENNEKINIRKINFKMNSLNMNLNISTENAIFTSFCTCSLSMIISLILKKNLFNNKYNLNKYNYKIIPIYLNTNSFKLDLKTDISCNMFNILEVIYQYNKVMKENKKQIKKKIVIKEILKRNIEGVKILERVRYVNKKVKAINK